MVATRWLSQRLEQDVRAEEEAELYRLESGASAVDDVDGVDGEATWYNTRMCMAFWPRKTFRSK